MKRSQIKAKKEKLLKKIDDLENQILELDRQDILLSDDFRRFEEKVESHPIVGRQKKQHCLDGKLVGRIFWKELFMDDETGKEITIERQRVVRVDGEWI